MTRRICLFFVASILTLSKAFAGENALTEYVVSQLSYSCFQEFIFWTQKTVSARIPEDFFFSCIFRRNFSQERGFGEVAGIPVFTVFTGIFRRNSCGTGFLYLLRNPPDSGGFLLPPKAAGSGQRLKKALC